MKDQIRIFSGTSGCKVADGVAKELGLEMGKSNILKFKDGEYYAKVDETVRGLDVFVVQSTSTPVNENIMGLLIFVDALKRASARSITLVIPYFGYARQDRKAHPREPITAKLISNLLTTAGATRIITLDLHRSQVQGFFDIPLDNLEALPLITKNLASEGLGGKETVVLSPSTGMVKNSRKLSEWLDSSMAIVDRRDEDGIEEIELIGDVKGKDVVILDDILATGHTVISASEVAKKYGARRVVVAVSHGLLVEDAIKNIDDSCIDKVYITDSIRVTDDRKSDKIEVIGVSKLFADTIERITTNKSIMSLFEK